MKISINKSLENGYTLKFHSGHFCGTLDEISNESLKDLHRALTSLLYAEDGETKKEMVWNPRSRRHEFK